jgi:hypothetical protein
MIVLRCVFAFDLTISLTMCRWCRSRFALGTPRLSRDLSVVARLMALCLPRRQCRASQHNLRGLKRSQDAMAEMKSTALQPRTNDFWQVFLG